MLVAEDDAYSRFVIEEILEHLGYECEAVENGERLFERLEAGRDAYMAILLDIHMPKISGIDVALKIRRDTPEAEHPIPIIAVTADVNFHTTESVRQFGFTDVLPKPVRVADLDAMLSRL